MTDLASIDTPQSLAVWLASDPTAEQRHQAFDALVNGRGYTAGTATWAQAVRLKDSIVVAVMMDRLDEGIRHEVPVVDALRAATGARFVGGAS